MLTLLQDAKRAMVGFFTQTDSLEYETYKKVSCYMYISFHVIFIKCLLYLC